MTKGENEILCVVQMISRELVDKPNALEFECSNDARGNLCIVIKCSGGNKPGRLIGIDGKLGDAIRLLAKSVGRKYKIGVYVDIVQD